MKASSDLVIGGLVPFTTIDFPGRLAAVVFCQGCPWRCDYCYNRHLWASTGEKALPWADVLAFLKARQGILDGVVFSGGEASLQPGLPDALRQVRALGYKAALHTNGAFPEKLKALLPLLDWVGLDIKAPFALYEKVTGIAGSGEKAEQALKLLQEWGGAFETRTTADLSLLSEDDLLEIARELAARGVKNWVLQPCRKNGETHLLDEALLARLRALLPTIVVR